MRDIVSTFRKVSTKRIKRIFGWMKTVGLLRQLRHRGGGTVEWIFCFTAAAYNLTRMRRLLAA